MATLARRLRQRLGVTSMFMLSGLVGTLCGFGGGAPALALPFPPPVQFTNCGSYTGTLQTSGMTLPLTGTLDYLTSGGQTNLLVETGGPARCALPPGSPPGPITSDTWVTSTPTVFNEWEIVSTDPTTCRKEVLPEDSPQCAPWQNPSPNQWSIKCTFTVQGEEATLLAQFTLSGNLVVSLVETTTFNGVTDSITKITIDSQAAFAPDFSTFNRPSICNAPNGNNQTENDNSQGNEGNEVGLEFDVCRTIPSICL